jgi:hypothetical protein
MGYWEVVKTLEVGLSRRKQVMGSLPLKAYFVLSFS